MDRQNKMNGERILLAAHRGDRSRYPENTMPAFSAAHEAGVDMIETDVHMTRDGYLVLMHDRNALRTCGVDGNVDEMTLEEVLRLDAGWLFDESFRKTSVPTLEEFCRWISQTELLINWELKDYPSIVGDAHAFAAADILCQTVERYGLSDRSMMNSFSARVLEHIVQTHSGRFQIHGQGIGKASRSKDVSNIPVEQLFDWCCLYGEEKDDFPEECEEGFLHCVRYGIIPCLCIPDDEDRYRKAIDRGCKMFTSNDICKADRILRKLGVR